MVYLDNAATSRFKPIKVKISVLRELNRSANPGRSGHDESIRAASEIEECRELIGKTFFEGKTVFTKNCTEALNLAIFGSRPKKQVVTTYAEHNSILRPLRYLQKTGQITLKVIAPDITELTEALKTPTSLVAITAMSNVTGEVNDIFALSKLVKERSDALFLCDMAQAAGHAKFSFDYVDMAAFAGHKSLHGIQGTGFLQIKKGISLSPLIMGGTGSYSYSLDHPNDVPEGMEAGTLNTVGIVALRHGIEWTNRHFDRINAKINAVFSHIKEGFENIDGLNIIAANNGIILANVKKIDPTDFASLLNENGIYVREGLHCAPLMHKKLGTNLFGAVRFSVGFNNDLSDAERTVEVVKGICHKAMG